mmetsp:Transcript_11513/g.14336  ORF Transcript_11513/g.14336 Transcript_11513/m.14336 type:complete len:191 (-) Transcript_11513:130-702(-)|eukprot:CAMPEP_0204834546 /NCGR_PEP_ID=MMETSP1346-20131115/20049_1 /ASSEMBLY_ACC=CAM_ASM_000771 /TAXON_ID=215587 /ORGANISM="Aplanochytrium stocchinoi, Strain GSBS06" /LENGTH=190 /DNA_ID=CAMNT_0051967915 /DNA_START=117 /DNA_END=689 /DNA_ORIENTATION=+
MGFLKIVYYSTMVLTWFGSTFVQGSFPGMRIFEGIKQDSVDMIAKALEEGDDINSIGPGEQTPLMHATLMGKPKSVKFLLKQGADPTIGEKDGYTPVHGASFQGRSDVMQILIDFGLDPNHKHSDGYAPIHRVCWGSDERHDETLKVLLDNGVDPETQSANGKTPIRMARRPTQKKILLEYIERKKAKEL